MGKKAPKAPDYAAAAREQAQSSREVTEQQSWANRPDQTTPWGSTTWDNESVWDPSTEQYINRWTQNQSLSPELQDALDSQFAIQGGRSDIAESMLGRARNEFGSEMDWSQFQEMGGVPDVPSYNRNMLPRMGQGPEAGQYDPESLQRDLSTEGLTDLDPSQRYYQDAGDAIYGQATSRLDPQWQQREQQMDSKLRNQGIKPGDEAYDIAMENLGRDRNDAYQQAQYGATIGAGSEAQRFLGMDASTRGQLFGERQDQGAFYNDAANQAFGQRLGGGAQGFQEQLNSGQFSNQQRQQLYNEMMGIGSQEFGQEMQGSNLQTQQRQQQIAEEMQRRGFSLNEMNALLTGQQVGTPNMPSFNTAARSEGTQNLAAAQMQGQAALDSFNAEQAAMQGMMSGAGSMAMGFSDRRLKKNIKPLGNGWYEFEYLWSDEKIVGVMADEHPEAAVMHPSGYLMVDYNGLR